MFRRTIVPLLVLGLIAVAPGGAAAASTLDQSQTVTTWNRVSFGPGAPIAQTFTAGITGTLDSVSLATDAYTEGTSNDAVVTVLATSGGVPTGSALATKSVTLVNGWNEVAFATPPHVVAGTMYAIKIVPSVGFVPRGNCEDAYPDGRLLMYVSSTWQTIPGFGSSQQDPTPYCGLDMGFRTYVTAAAAALDLTFTASATHPVEGVLTPETVVISVANSGDAATDSAVYVYTLGEFPLTGTRTDLCVPTGACTITASHISFGVIEPGDTVTLTWAGWSFNGVGTHAGDTFTPAVAACIGDAMGVPTAVNFQADQIPVPAGCVEQSVEIVVAAADATPSPSASATRSVRPSLQPTPPPTVAVDDRAPGGSSPLAVLFAALFVFAAGLLVAARRARRDI